MPKLYKPDIKCPNCKNQMTLDDIDKNCAGNQTEWYLCEDCGICARVEVKFGQIVNIEYRDAYGDEMEDY